MVKNLLFDMFYSKKLDKMLLAIDCDGYQPNPKNLQELKLLHRLITDGYVTTCKCGCYKVSEKGKAYIGQGGYQYDVAPRLINASKRLIYFVISLPLRLIWLIKG